MNKGLIWIGNDQGGYELKLHVMEYLKQKGIPFHNAGSDSVEMVRYPYYAAVVAEAILRGEAERGILICSTGIGMSLIANKYRGIRASVCTSTYMGKMTRAHNDSNVLCLGGKITGVFEALDILEAWLSTPYDGGRHAISLGLISQAEKALTVSEFWNPEDPMRT
jgi:ribose 5-phosphate isomerase B